MNKVEFIVQKEEMIFETFSKNSPHLPLFIQKIISLTTKEDYVAFPFHFS